MMTKRNYMYSHGQKDLYHWAGARTLFSTFSSLSQVFHSHLLTPLPHYAPTHSSLHPQTPPPPLILSCPHLSLSLSRFQKSIQKKC